MANTDITLRLDKGSTLTFNEMDTNFTSFFYSASTHIVEGANKLRLFYTGSGNLDSPFNTVRYEELALPTATSTGGSATDPAGNNREIQFNDNGAFGASSLLKFTEASNTGPRLGLGISPRYTLDLQSTNTNTPTIFNLNASSNTANNNSKAYIQFKQGGNTFGQFGKRSTGNNKIDFFAKSQLILGTHNFADGTTNNPISIKRKLNVSTGGILIGESLGETAAPGTADLAIIGSLGIGSDTTVSNTSFIGASNIGSSLLPSNSVSNGLLIQSPKSTNGGHVIIGINTDSGNHESFSIVKGSAGSFDTQIATFGADGKVGIGNINPKEVLHVNGNITGSGNFSVDGTAHIKITQTGLHTDKALVITDKGQVKEMVASPIPLGGIIMWSGTTIPAGWTLCDGTGGANGITVPDLTDRFIVSSGTTHGLNTTGGSCNHNHGGTTGASSLTISQLPPHAHCTRDAYYIENGVRNNVVSPGGTESIGGGHGGSGDSDSDNNTIHFMCRLTQTTGSGQSHSHSIGLADHLPRYYALAFIIYVGA